MVKLYDGDVKLLGSTEKFFLALADIPDIEKRLDIWLFKQNFDEFFTYDGNERCGFSRNANGMGFVLVSEARNKLQAVEHALDDLEKSDTFKQLLRIILAVGNYLNAGTKKGQAFGFKLGSLRMLDSTKTSDNSKTLLQVGWLSPSSAILHVHFAIFVVVVVGGANISFPITRSLVRSLSLGDCRVRERELFSGESVRTRVRERAGRVQE